MLPNISTYGYTRVIEYILSHTCNKSITPKGCSVFNISGKVPYYNEFSQLKVILALIGFQPIFDSNCAQVGFYLSGPPPKFTRFGFYIRLAPPRNFSLRGPLYIKYIHMEYVFIEFHNLKFGFLSFFAISGLFQFSPSLNSRNTLPFTNNVISPMPSSILAITQQRMDACNNTPNFKTLVQYN